MLNAFLWPLFIIVVASGVLVAGLFAAVLAYEMLHDIDDRLARAHNRFLHALHTIVHPHEWHFRRHAP
jgi:hypothetical protein